MSAQPPEQVMSFILDQQAKLTVRMEQLTIKVDHLTDAESKSEKRISELESALTAGVNLVNSVHQKMGEMADAQIKAEAEMSELRQQMAATNARLDQNHIRLDETYERLDIFINVLERYINENRNGKHPPNNQ